MKNIAIIPARGRSKRIPRKNIKLFYGKPIIQYSIDAAIKSKCFDEIMVSTDDKEIAQLSQKFDAKVPFLRSKKTSSDFATLADVCEEVILKYKKIGKVFDYFCCILATAPFISVKRLKQAYLLLNKSKADALVPVVEFSYPIYRALKIKCGKLKMIWPENYNTRSQDLEPTFYDCGQFYWMKVNKFLIYKKFFTNNTIAFKIPESEAQDIDTKEDWEVAELKYKILKIK